MTMSSTYTPADVREGDLVAYKIRGIEEVETSGIVSASTVGGTRWRVTDSRPGAAGVWAEDGSVGWYLVSDDDKWAVSISDVRLIERASEAEPTYTPADVREGDRVEYRIHGRQTSGIVSASTTAGSRWHVTDASDGDDEWCFVDSSGWSYGITDVRLIEPFSVRASAHESDIALISAALHEEARRRDWCTEFEDFLDRLNPRLSISLTKPEPRVVRVTHEVTIEGATSDEDAIARALTQSTHSGGVVSAEVVQP